MLGPDRTATTSLIGSPGRRRPRLGWQYLARCASLRRQRRALAALDPHLLDDIGLSPAEAADEAARPFWEAAWDRRG